MASFVASPLQADILVTNEAGVVVAQIEVKARFGSPQWAKALKDALARWSAIAPSAYFVLVTKDSIYIWAPIASEESVSHPPIVLSTNAVLGKYFARVGLTPEESYEEPLIYAMSGWLRETASNVQSGRFPIPSPELTSFAGAISGADVRLTE